MSTAGLDPRTRTITAPEGARKWRRNPDYERVAHGRMLAAMELAGIRPAPDAKLPEAWTIGGETDGIAALVGREPVGYLPMTREPDMRWHISVNGGDRMPTWLEMTSAAHDLRPGVGFVIGVPPRSHYMPDIESGRFVLHLWQMKDDNLAENWMSQRQRGGRPPS